MAQKKKGKANRNTKQSIPPKPLNSNTGEAEKNKSNSNSSQQANPNISGKCPQIIVNVPQQEDTIGRKANKISLWNNVIQIISIVANLGILIATYFILRETKKTVAVASESLKETQKQFVITNEPYIQIFRPAMKSMAANQNLTVHYAIKNYGQLPAIIKNNDNLFGVVDSAAAAEYKKDPFKFINLIKEDTTTKINWVIAKEGEDTLAFPAALQLDEITRQDILVGKRFILFGGRMKYTSPVYPTMHEYIYLVRIVYEANMTTGKTSSKYEFFYNEQMPIKPKEENTQPIPK